MYPVIYICFKNTTIIMRRLSRWHSGKKSACQCRDARGAGLNPGSGRSPGAGHGSPLQCSCLENPRDRGAWWAAVYGVAQSWTWLKQLSSGSSSKESDTTKHAAAHALQGRTNSGKFSIQFSLESHCILIMKYSTVTLRKHI